MAFRRLLQRSFAPVWRVSTALLARRTASTVNDSTKILTCPYPSIDIPKSNFYSFVYSQFEEYGSKTAVIDGASGEKLSYNEIGEMTAKVGSALRKKGLQKGDVLAIISPNSAAFGVQFFATVAIGCTVTTMNPTFTKSEIAYQLKDSGAKHVATISALLPIVKEAAAEVGIPDGNVIVLDGEGSSPHPSFRSLLEDSGSQFPVGGESVDPEDTTFLPYSSGTTGLPKGVMLTHSNLISNICQCDHPKLLDMRMPSNTITGVLPFYHIYGLTTILASTWHQGSTIVSLPKFEPASFLSAMDRYKVTVGYLAPPLVLFLAKHPLVDQYNLSSLHSVVSAAAPLGTDISQAVKDRIGVQHVRQAYGLTESSPLTHVCPLDVLKLNSIGSIVRNTEGCVLDCESGDALGPDQVGELLVRGPQVMKGYLNRTEATAKSVTEDGWFCTGDLAYYDSEGHFYIVDRLKELIKVKGMQVAPAELEDVLLSHPHIADAAVVGVADEWAGEIPKAFVVLKSGGMSEKDVQEFMSSKVAQHKQLKGGVVFVDAIPKSPSGKILRRILREH